MKNEYAFPHPSSLPIRSVGMTLRDYYIGQVITGLVSGSLQPDIKQRISFIGYARTAHELVDAILEIRDQK
jgi:hypothetical protein